MVESGHSASALMGRIGRVAPGMPALLRYRRADFPRDLVAGLSVAAVALPIGVAYAQLAGFDPVLGLYVSILPLVAYAIFGTSRQLVVGPDAATCALIFAAVTPLAAGDGERYVALAIALTAISGVLLIGASFLRLGALADFLSKPILVGYLNGIGLYIFAGQIGKVFGVSIEAHGILPTLIELGSKFDQIHWATATVGITSFAVILLSSRVLRRVPAALVALALATAAVALFGLEARGVAVVGAVESGLPTLRVPSIPLQQLPELLAAAAGLALVSFSSMMLTARSFASKNGYEIDVDREMSALGAANLAAAASQGFAISGADSRTAVADSAGGRTQVTGLISAAAIAVVLLFLTGALAIVPIAVLGAVLIKASFSLLDLRTLRRLYRIDRGEFLLCLIATVGVIWVGAVQAILVVVILALIRFVRITSRPPAEILGKVEGMRGLHGIQRHPEATTFPGMVLFRFNAPLVFFNAPYFKKRAREAADAAGPDLKWFVLDAIPLSQIDVSGMYALEELAAALHARGIQLVAAGRMTETAERRAARRFRDSPIVDRHFPTLRAAVRAFTALESDSDGAGTAASDAPPAAPGMASEQSEQARTQPEDTQPNRSES